jgi:hypothetical protein
VHRWRHVARLWLYPIELGIYPGPDSTRLPEKWRLVPERGNPTGFVSVIRFVCGGFSFAKNKAPQTGRNH